MITIHILALNTTKDASDKYRKCFSYRDEQVVRVHISPNRDKMHFI